MTTPYGLAALRSEADFIRATPPGGRNGQLFKSAARLARLLASGDLDEIALFDALGAAAIDAGLTNVEARRTIKSAVHKAARDSRWLGDRGTTPSIPRQVRPPKEAVSSFWRACQPIVGKALGAGSVGDAARALLASKGADPVAVARADLARLAPARLDAHSQSWWPRQWWRRWPIIVPASEPDGTLASVHARAAHGATVPKTVWPTGGYSASGLVFAAGASLALLRGEQRPACEQTGVLIVEGLTDFVAATLWANRRRERSRDRLAVIGIVSGSVSALPRIQVPPDLPWCIGTDNDEAGDRYAAAIRAALPHARIKRVVLGGRDE